MTATRSCERGARAVAWPARLRGDVPAIVLRAAGAVAAAATVVCAVVIAARRFSGAIASADPLLLCGAAAGGIALVLVTDAARRAGASVVGSVAARCGLVLGIAALAVPPAARDAAGWTAFLAAATAVAAAVARLPWHTVRPAREVSSGVPRDGASRPGRRARREPPPGLLRQRIERRELAEGAEMVRGRIVIAVPAGARTGYGHLGFCPAFTATPSVEATTAYDGVEVIVTAAEVLPWGVRVECRLAEPAEEALEIPVDLVARAPAAGP